MGDQEIHEVFKFFKLDDDEKRKNILKQGVSYSEPNENSVSYIYLDNNTEPKREEEIDGGLESIIR